MKNLILAITAAIPKIKTCKRQATLNSVDLFRKLQVTWDAHSSNTICFIHQPRLILHLRGIDIFSRFLVIYFLKSTRSANTIKDLRKYWLLKYLTFGVFLIAQGRQFISLETRYIATMLGFGHLLITAHNPSCNSTIERPNRLLMSSFTSVLATLSRPKKAIHTKFDNTWHIAIKWKLP